jgi:hypothetical protein
MYLIVNETECAGNAYWIVRNTGHSWFYHGPFETETAAQAFVSKKSGTRKALQHAAQVKRMADHAADAACAALGLRSH